MVGVGGAAVWAAIEPQQAQRDTRTDRSFLPFMAIDEGSLPVEHSNLKKG